MQNAVDKDAKSNWLSAFPLSAFHIGDNPYGGRVSDATSGTDSFSATAAEGVLVAACAQAELDDDGARLLRLGENALFHLPTEAVVVRIARTMDYWRDAAKEVSVSRWLAGAQFPAAQVHLAAQPIAVSGHPVTFWRFIDGRDGSPADIAGLGALLRRLHTMPRPTEFDLPGEDILGRVRRRIEAAPVPATDKDFLTRRFHELSAAVSGLRYPLSAAPTHGDAHVQNLMVRDGRPILIDFERFAWGHPEWDISMTATEYLTAGWWTDAQYDSFVQAYGYDVTSWSEGFPVLRAVHEIKMTTWLMQNVNESPEIAREYEARMQTIRGQGEPPWRPF
jgi:Ser/Thr protein kinase RdoA (MazF antagonist)